MLDLTNGTPITEAFPYQYSRTILNERVEDYKMQRSGRTRVKLFLLNVTGHQLMNSQLPPPTEELWTVGGFYGRESWFYLVMWHLYIIHGLVDGHTPMSI